MHASHRPTDYPSSPERGVILPLAAVVLLGVVTLLFAAGVDSFLVRIARSELQDAAQRICQAVSHDIMAPDAAVDGFRAGVEHAGQTLRGARLNEASLILALPNEATLPPIDPAYLCSSADKLTRDDRVAAEPAGGSASGYFESDFGIPKCSAAGLRDCTLWAYPNVKLPAGVPAEAGKLLLPGRGVGCALSAEVKGTPFQVFIRPSGESPLVRAHALYSTARLSDDDPKGAVNSFEAPLGLRLAISTQLATPPLTLPPGDSILNVEVLPMSFAAVRRLAEPSGAGLDRFIELHDPLCGPPLTPAAPWCPEYRTGKPFMIPSIEHTRAFSGARPTEDYENGVFMRGGLGLTETQRMEMLISCINPPVLIRNIIASTIVGLAARDPVLRRHTEITHIDSLQVLARLDHSDSRSFARSPSTVLVPIGSDITERAFQIPLVHFRQDDIFRSDGTREVKGVGALDGDLRRSAASLYPLSDSTPPYTKRDEVIHSELANQLRRCLHLYTGLEDGATEQRAYRGLDAINPSLLTESRYGLLTSDRERGAFSFHRMLYQGSGTSPAIESEGRYGGEEASGEGRVALNLDAALFPVPPGSASRRAQPQGNEWPWDSITPSLTNSRRLTATELVSVLGSSQRCPYSDIRGDLSPGSEVWCPSPGAEVNPDQLTKQRAYAIQGIGLQPDFSSLLAPLTQPLPRNESLPDWYQVSSKVVDPLQGHSLLDFVGRARAPKCRDAGLIVLTHSFGNEVHPEMPAEGSQVQDPPLLSLNEKAFDTFRTGAGKEKSPLVIVVIPTVSNLPRMDTLSTNLLNITDFSEDPNVHILMLAPPGCVDAESATTCSDRDFHRYWSEVLDPNNPSYVEYMARDFFSTIINGGLPKRAL